MKEIWKDIKGYEGIYQASNLGRIKSLQREVWNGYQNVLKKERILKPRKDRKGYVNYILYNNNISKGYKGHFLVLNSFTEKPKDKDQINHINGIKDDNRLINLEWCNNSENQIHAINTGLKKTKKGYYEPPKPKLSKEELREKQIYYLNKYRALAIQNAKGKNSKKVAKMDKDNNILKIYNSITEAEKDIGGRIHLEAHTSHGYIWKYV